MICGTQVVLEFRKGAKPPTDTTVGFSVEYVWKSTTFDRMQNALKLFAVDETSVSGYLYHRHAPRARHRHVFEEHEFLALCDTWNDLFVSCI